MQGAANVRYVITIGGNYTLQYAAFMCRSCSCFCLTAKCNKFFYCLFDDKICMLAILGI